MQKKINDKYVKPTNGLLCTAKVRVLFNADNYRQAEARFNVLLKKISFVA
jgi:hypothetical protein